MGNKYSSHVRVKVRKSYLMLNLEKTRKTMTHSWASDEINLKRLYKVEVPEF